MYPRLEAGTREALERGVEATLPGDEGHAAWLQYREIKVGEAVRSCCNYFGVLAMTYSLIPRPRAGFVNCSDIFLGIYNTPVEAWPVYSLSSLYSGVCFTYDQ